MLRSWKCQTVQIVAVYSPKAAIAMEQHLAVVGAVGSIEAAGHYVLRVLQMAEHRTEYQMAYAVVVHFQKARNEAYAKDLVMG